MEAQRRPPLGLTLFLPLNELRKTFFFPESNFTDEGRLIWTSRVCVVMCLRTVTDNGKRATEWIVLPDATPCLFCLSFIFLINNLLAHIFLCRAKRRWQITLLERLYTENLCDFPLKSTSLCVSSNIIKRPVPKQVILAHSVLMLRTVDFLVKMLRMNAAERKSNLT